MEFVSGAIKHLVEHLGASMLVEITDREVEAYQTSRLMEKATGKTINDEVGVLFRVMGDSGDMPSGWVGIGPPIWPYREPAILLFSLNFPAYCISLSVANAEGLIVPMHHIVVFPTIAPWWWLFGFTLDDSCAKRLALLFPIVLSSGLDTKRYDFSSTAVTE